MMVGYTKASVPLSVRTESVVSFIGGCSSFDISHRIVAFIGGCSFFDIIARTEYSLKLFSFIFDLLKAH